MMKTISRLFLRGLLVIIPILVTASLLYWFFVTMEQLFRVPLQLFLPEDWYVNGLGLVFALLFTFCVGLVVDIYAVNLVFKAFEKLLNRLPLIKQVYSSIRDLTSFLGGNDRNHLQKVVALDCNGLRLVGFVTAEDTALPGGTGNKAEDADDDKLLSVYLPMSYQVGGYMVYVPASRCQFLDVPVQEAMQTILTANIGRGGSEE